MTAVRKISARLPGDPAKLIPPLAMLAAGWVSAVLAPAGAAETRGLAFSAAAVLLAAAALAPAPAIEIAIGAVMASLALWFLPPGSERGGALFLGLLAILSISAYRRLRRSLPGIQPLDAVALALGFQVLMKGESLLTAALDLAGVADLVLVPVLAGGAVAFLARGSDRNHPQAGLGAIAAMAAAVTLGGGWTRISVLGLLGLAAGHLLHRSRTLPVRIISILALLAPLALNQRVGLIATVTGLVLALGGRRPRLALVVSAVPLLSGLAVAPESARTWGEAFSLLSWLPLLLPTVLLVPRDRRPTVAGGLLLTLASARLAPAVAGGLTLLAAPLALVALHLPLALHRGLGEEGAERREADTRERIATVLQLGWSGLLTVTAAAFATYPWLRGEPPKEALEAFGLSPGWIAAASVAAIATSIAVFLPRLPGIRSHRRRPETSSAAIATALLAACALGALPAAPSARPIDGAVVLLDATRSSWAANLEGAAVRWVVLDSMMSHAAAIPAGTSVATLWIDAGDGAREALSVQAGIDTGEWAARRSDVVATPGFEAPLPWLSQLAGEGGFLAQRYRAHWRLPQPIEAARIAIVRSPELPPEVTLAVYGLECRP